MTLTASLCGVALLLLLAPAAVGLARHARAGIWLYGACLAICLAGLVLAAGSLGAPSQTLVLPLGLPWQGAHFRLDPLSAFFLAMTDLGGAAASLYAIGHARHDPDPGRVLPFYPVFLAGMMLVVLADDAFAFLFSWEMMSLSSWALVMSRHGEAETRKAGYVYLLMAVFGTICLLLAFALLSGPAAGFTFESFRARPPAPTLSALVLVLALLGAGSKAGIVPLHVWLPLAHPAAPSHVSALMSGVMTKIALYGLIRIAFDLLGPPVWWWGAPFLALGGVTAVLGILHALMQKDLKRILAYSTIENIGIILIGLGLALAFKADGMGRAAALATTALLFHVFNHVLYKCLLFFGAGAVLSATGSRDMDQMGGLIHRMPVTALSFLVGSAAITALPPFNGFVSEWLTLQAVLLSPTIPQWSLKLLIPAAGALLALAATLAGGCFVRAFGLTFLGRPRSALVAKAEETGPAGRAAMLIMAGLCLLAGILPGSVIDALSPIALQLSDARMPPQLSQAWLTIVPIAESRSSYNGLLVFLFILWSTAIAALVVHRLASRALRRGPAWDCGYPEDDPTTQYSPDGFAQPIRRVFGSVAFQARDQVDMPPPGSLRAASLAMDSRDLVWENLYLPLARLVIWLADHLNPLQFLTIRRYLSLVFLSLVFLLLVLALWS